MNYKGAKNKTRINLTIDKDFKVKLEAIAKEENRSFNNLVITVMQQYVSDRENRH